jgi:hypothetical protein
VAVLKRVHQQTPRWIYNVFFLSGHDGTPSAGPHGPRRRMACRTAVALDSVTVAGCLQTIYWEQCSVATWGWCAGVLCWLGATVLFLMTCLDLADQLLNTVAFDELVEGLRSRVNWLAGGLPKGCCCEKKDSKLQQPGKRHNWRLYGLFVPMRQHNQPHHQPALPPEF